MFAAAAAVGAGSARVAPSTRSCRSWEAGRPPAHKQFSSQAHPDWVLNHLDEAATPAHLLLRLPIERAWALAALPHVGGAGAAIMPDPQTTRCIVKRPTASAQSSGSAAGCAVAPPASIGSPRHAAGAQPHSDCALDCRPCRATLRRAKPGLPSSAECALRSWLRERSTSQVGAWQRLGKANHS